MKRNTKRIGPAGAALVVGAALLVAGVAIGDQQGDRTHRPNDHQLALTWIIRNDGGQTGWEVNLNEPALPLRKHTGYYQAYLQGPQGRVSVGTFNAAGDPGLTLWSGVSPVDYTHFVVVSEPDGRVVATADVDVERGEHHASAQVELRP